VKHSFDRAYFTALVDLHRADANDPHSAIDYAALGADIECRANGGELAAFARRFGMSTDGAMRALATFCLFKSTGVCERLAGRIDAAQLAEMNAETVYTREIAAANRW
jgi:hypothetical protein